MCGCLPTELAAYLRASRVVGSPSAAVALPCYDQADHRDGEMTKGGALMSDTSSVGRSPGRMALFG